VTVVRRASRTLAVLLGGLSLAGGGALTAAGVAWSAGGRHHAKGPSTGGKTTTTTASPTTTQAATTTTTANSSTTASSKHKTQSSAKPSSTAKKPKPKPKPKPVVRLSAALLSALQFPERAVGLWTLPAKPLVPGQVHVSENGTPVSGVKLTPLSHASSGDFGVVVVLDESSALDPTSRGLELAAAETIAAQRAGSARLGLVTFSAQPTVMLPLTNNSPLIHSVLTSPPLIAPGSSLLPALKLAYSQLRQAHVPVGAVVVLTAGRNLADPAAEAAATQAGLKLGYQTFVSDVAATPSGHSAKMPEQDSQQDKALGQPLIGGAGAWSRLAGGYVATYRSGAHSGQNVTVTVTADGLSGTPTMQYIASAVPAPTQPGLAPPSSGALSKYPSWSARPAFGQYVPTAAPALTKRRSTSFWSSPLSLVLVAVACALLLAVAVLLVVSGVRQSEVETRVARFIPQEEMEDEQDSLVLATPAAPAILSRRRWWPRFVLEVDVARFQRSPVSLVRLAVGGSLVTGVLLTILFGSIVGFVLGLPVGPVVLYAVVKRAARKSRERFAEQLPSHLLDMGGAIRGGRSIAGAMMAVVDGADEPTLGEFERVVADEQLGKPLETSLHTVAERMKSEDMDQVALVAALHRRSGSSVAEALDHVADGARDRAELVRELNSLTGQARLSSRILTALPFAMVTVLLLIAPTYMRPLVHTVAGIAVMVMCAVMVGLGWLVMRRMTNVEA
jgi:tight adherence protein B